MIELTAPFASGENISDIKSQGIGPNPIEVPIINRQREINGNKLIFIAKLGEFFKYQK